MTGAGGDTGRGVRAAARGLHTWRQLAGMVFAAALIGAVSAAVWKATNTTTAHHWYAVGMLVLAETLIDAGLNPRRTKEIRHPNGRTETVTYGAIANHRPLLALRKRMIDDLLDAALAGLAIGAGIAVAILAALHYAGGRLKRGRRLRGGELVSARQLRRRVVRAAPDRDTAEWSAESLGRAEIEEMAESVDYGAETLRDSVTLGARRALRKPGKAKGAIKRASEAEAAVDLWGPDLPPPGNGNPASASRPGATPPAIESGADEEKASAVRTNPGAERSEAADEPRDATRPEGGMIRI